MLVILCVNDVKLFMRLLDGEGERKEVGVISSETGEEGTITNDDDDDEINEEISESVSLSLVIIVITEQNTTNLFHLYYSE